MEDFLNSIGMGGMDNSLKQVKTWAIAMLAVSSLHLLISYFRK